MLSPPPRDFPLKDVLVSTEIACKHLSAPKAQGLKAEVTKCINKAKRPASNISKGEFKALQELKADTDITILAADKGRSTVILNTTDYESKMSTLLSDITILPADKGRSSVILNTKDYESKMSTLLSDITILPADKGRSTVILNTKDYESKMSTLLSDITILPADKGRSTVILNTTDYESKMSTLLSDITILPADKGRSTVILNSKDYESKMSILLSDINMYEVLQKDPTPKIKREEKKKSLRCMAYLRSTRRMSLYDQSLQAEEASYTWQTFLAPLVGKSECHIKNSGDFVDKIKNLEVPPGQKVISYDVSALFTSIPVPDAIKAVRIKLDEDPKLQDLTPLSRERIPELLSFFLNTTYFTYKGVMYKQKRDHQCRP